MACGRGSGLALACDPLVDPNYNSNKPTLRILPSDVKLPTLPPPAWDIQLQFFCRACYTRFNGCSAITYKTTMKHRVDVCFLVDCVISRPSRRTVSRWLRVSRHRKVWWFDFGIGLPFTASIGSDVFGECEASDNKGLPNYFVVTSKDITARITSTHPPVKMTKICAVSLDKAFNFLVGRSLPQTLP